MPSSNESQLDPNLAAAYLSADRDVAASGDAENEAVSKELTTVQEHVASAFASPATPAQVAAAAASAKRSLHEARARNGHAGVAGRIGVGSESDGTSNAWRIIRWPLAAAASLVAGLVVVTFVTSDGHRQEQVALGGDTNQNVEVDIDLDLNSDGPVASPASFNVLLDPDEDWSAAVAYVDADTLLGDVTDQEVWTTDDLFDFGG